MVDRQVGAGDDSPKDEAERIFIERVVNAATSASLDALVAEHPGFEAELRVLHQDWEIAVGALGVTMPSTVMVNPESQRVESVGVGTWDEFLDRLRRRVDVAQRYVLKGEIARGGMGVVHRVYDTDLKRPLAMKVILGSGDAARTGQTPLVDPKTLGRFIDEAQITGQLDHPGIVPVHEVGVDNQGRVFFTMKLVKGEELTKVIERLHAGDKDVTLTRVLGILLRVCEALSYAHEKGVIHRDLKPSNIMVGKHGEVYVMDWGLARLVDKSADHEPDRAGDVVSSARRRAANATPEVSLLTRDGDVMGTPAYMSPEQAAGDGRIGPTSDVYSIGATLYHILTGRPPYDRGTRQVSPDVVLTDVLRAAPTPIVRLATRPPPQLVSLCEKAMARDPDDRYASAKDLADDLRAFLEDRVVRAYRTGPTAEMAQWIRRNRGTAASIASATVVIAGLTGLFVAGMRERGDRLESRNEELRRTNVALVEAQKVAAAKETERRWAEYVSQIRAAQAAIEAGDVDQAGKFLESCPEEHRGWEWHHLANLQDPSLLSIEVHRAAAGLGPNRFPQASEYIRSIEWSPDGDRLYAAGHAAVYVLDPTAGVIITATDLVDESRVVDIAVSDDGRFLAALQPHRLELIDTVTMLRVWSLDGPDLGVFDREMRSLAFSKDGSLIAVVGDWDSVTLLNASDGSVSRSIPRHFRQGHSVSFHPTRTIVAVGGDYSSVEAIDYSETGEARYLMRESRDYPSNYVQSICFDESGSWLLAGMDGMRRWDVERWELVSERLIDNEYVSERNWVDAQSNVVSHTHAYKTDLLDLSTGRLLGKIPRRYGTDVKLSPGAGHVAVAADSEVYLYSALTKATGRALVAKGCGWARSGALVSRNRFFSVTGLAFGTSGVADDNYVRVTELGRGESWQRDYRMRCYSQTISANGQRIVVATDTGVEVLDTKTGDLLSARDYPDRRPLACAIDADGRYVAVSGRGWIDVLDGDAGSLLWREQVEAEEPPHLIKVSIARDAALVVADDPGYVADSPAVVWFPREDRQLAIRYERGSGLVFLSPDGKRLAIDEGGRTSIYDPIRPEALATVDTERMFSVVGWTDDGDGLIGHSCGPGDNRDGVVIWRANVAAAALDWNREESILRATERVRVLMETPQWPEDIESAIDAELSLEEHEREVMHEVRRGLGDEISWDWRWEALKICQRSGLAPERYEYAERLAEAAMRIVRCYEKPYLELGAARLRMGRFEEARTLFLKEIEINVERGWERSGDPESAEHDEEWWNTFQPDHDRIVYHGSAELKAWLALAEAKLGLPAAPPAGMEFPPVRLSSLYDRGECRVVQEARAACGLPVNPEGLPSIPDDD